MSVLDAVNDYILQYTDVVQDNLYRGYQNRSTLPQTQDYTMYYVERKVRIGTNVDKIEDIKTTVYSLQEYVVNIDFCGDNQETVEQRATDLAVLGRSFLSVNFFKTYSINFDYAEDVNYLPYVDETDQYVQRYRIVLHLTKWESVEVKSESAIHADVYVENVDAHHKP